MIVKIIKSSNVDYWYSGMIGMKFEYMSGKGLDTVIVFYDGSYYHVAQEDCEILDESYIGGEE